MPLLEDLSADPAQLNLPPNTEGARMLERLFLGGVSIQAWTPYRKTLEDWYLELSAKSPDPA